MRTLRDFRSRGCVVRIGRRFAVELCHAVGGRAGGLGGLSRSAASGSRHTLPPCPATRIGVAHTANPHIRHIVNASGSGCQNEAGPNLGPHALHLANRLTTVGGGRTWQPGKSQTFRLPSVRPATMRCRDAMRAFTRLAVLRYRALTAAAPAFARARRGRVRRDQGIHILREQVEGRRKLVLVNQRHHAPPRMLAATPCRSGTNRTRRQLRTVGETERPSKPIPPFPPPDLKSKRMSHQASGVPSWGTRRETYPWLRSTGFNLEPGTSFLRTQFLHSHSVFHRPLPPNRGFRPVRREVNGE